MLDKLKNKSWKFWVGVVGAAAVAISEGAGVSEILKTVLATLGF